MNTFIKQDDLSCNIKNSIQECTDVHEIIGIIILSGKIFNISQQDVVDMFKSEINEWVENHITDNSVIELRIKNDRDTILSTIKIKYERVLNKISVDDESLEDCIIDDVDGDDENTVYDIIINPNRDIVEELSNETLLNEIKNRMIR